MGVYPVLPAVTPQATLGKCTCSFGSSQLDVSLTSASPAHWECGPAGEHIHRHYSLPCLLWTNQSSLWFCWARVRSLGPLPLEEPLMLGQTVYPFRSGES